MPTKIKFIKTDRYKDSVIKYKGYDMGDFAVILFYIASTTQEEAELVFNDVCEVIKKMNSRFDNSFENNINQNELALFSEFNKPVQAFIVVGEDEPFITRKIKEIFNKESETSYFINEIDYKNEKLINKRFPSVFAEYVNTDVNDFMDFFLNTPS